MKNRYLKETFEKIVKESKTKKEVLEKLGITCKGGSYKTIAKYILLYDLNTSHFTSNSEIFKGNFKSFIKDKIPLEDILVENSTYDRKSLKARLYTEGLKKRECEECGQGETWRGKKISLILDHKNGINNDNRLINLRILCPNCNATLETHCRGFKKIKKEKTKEEKEQLKLNQYIQNSIKKRKKERPEYEILKSEIALIGYSATGRKYGVSDNTIRKWIKIYEKLKQQH